MHMDRTPRKNEGISRGKFLAYETIRASGVTNMWDVRAVIRLADATSDFGLTEGDCLDIMRHYDRYAKRYLTGRPCPGALGETGAYS